MTAVASAERRSKGAAQQQAQAVQQLDIAASGPALVLPRPARAGRKGKRGGKRMQRARVAAQRQEKRAGAKKDSAKDELERYEAAKEETFAIINDILRRRSPPQRATEKQAEDRASLSAPAVSAGQRIVSAKSVTTRNPDGSKETDTGTSSSGRLVEVLEFLRGLGLSIEDCGKIVKRRPQMLRLSVPRSTQPYIDYLRSAPVCMDDLQVRRAVRTAPQLFAYKIPMFGKRVSFLTDVVGLDKSDLAATLSKRPHLLWMDLARAHAVANWLTAELSLGEGEIAKIVKFSPMVFLDAQKHLVGTLNWMRSELGLTETEQLRTFVTRFPKIFSFRIETSVQRRVDYLRDELNLPQETIRQIALECPVTLEKSVESELRPSVEALFSWQLVADNQELAVFLRNAPKIFYTNFVDRLRFLNDEVKLDTAQLKTVVSAFPSTLVLSVDRTLSPKWQFLTKTFCGTREDLVQVPHYFSASLERVLLPRFAFMCTKNKRPALADIVNGSNAEFCQKVANCEVEEYDTFEKNGRWVLVYTPVM